MRLGDTEAPAGLPPAWSFPSACLQAALAGLEECVKPVELSKGRAFGGGLE